MNDENEAAQAEGEALPVVTPPPVVAPIANTAERVLAAVEAWYAKHFHAHAVAGTAPISANDRDALIQHVTDAVAPTTTQE